jgi:hypothetical protein
MLLPLHLIEPIGLKTKSFDFRPKTHVKPKIDLSYLQSMRCNCLEGTSEPAIMETEIKKAPAVSRGFSICFTFYGSLVAPDKPKK